MRRNPPALKFYLPQDGLADLLLQQSAESLHFSGRAGRSVNVSAGRVEEAPLLLRHLGEDEAEERQDDNQVNKKKNNPETFHERKMRKMIPVDHAIRGALIQT